VEAVYVQISEIDHGPDTWPFSDTIMIIGTVTLETLEAEQETINQLRVAAGQLAQGSGRVKVTRKWGTGNSRSCWRANQLVAP